MENSSSLGPGPRLGLALAGGARRGLAHLGVIQVLEEAGFQASMVSGVSAGALVAACYAAGLKAAQLSRLQRDFRWRAIARPILLNPFRQGWDRLGLVDFFNLELMLIRHIGDVTFDELALPLALGATDLMTGERVLLTSGRVASAVRASVSIAGVAAPVHTRGRLLCDGVFSNNVPTQVLRDMGADVVLAVNIMPAHRGLPSNPLWAGSCAFSHLVTRAGDPHGVADLVIEPDIAEHSYVRGQDAELVQKGRRAMQAKLAELRHLIAPVR